jgi:prepilin-type N-terminal cleavage/methylation domain-containing protein
MATSRRADTGFSLTEMMMVVAMFGTVLAVVFGAVQVLTTSAATNMEESAAAHDLSYSMEVMSKTLMSGRIIYASDYQMMAVTRGATGSYELQSIYATATPGAARGSLVWLRWSSDASGAVAPGAAPTFQWVMSDRNVNSITPKVPLFAYYTGASNDSTASASAGGYDVLQIRRIRLHVLAAFNSGVRDDSRDIVLR